MLILFIDIDHFSPFFVVGSICDWPKQSNTTEGQRNTNK